MWTALRESTASDSNSLSDLSDVSDVDSNNLIVATESTGNHDYDFDCYYCDGCKTNPKDEYEGML